MRNRDRAVPPGEELTGLDWDALVANPLEDH